MEANPGIVEAVVTALQSQVGTGVIALSLVGSVIAACRKLPGVLWEGFLRLVTVKVELVGGEQLYRYFNEWMDTQPSTRESRLLTASLKDSEGGERVMFAPAPGNHVFWHRGRPIWLKRERKEVAGGSNGEWGGYRETITLRMLGRKQAEAEALLKEAVESRSRGRRTRVYYNRWNEWIAVREASPRALESVVLPAGVMEEIVAQVGEWLNGREWHEARGLSWRLSYLLAGIPGSGKTSLVKAIAGHFGMDLYILPITDRGMSDTRIVGNMADIPERSIVLLDDVDCIVNGRESIGGENGGVSFAALLSILDGACSREGLLVFMATNHPEKLDPALIRPGRMDHRIDFAAATQEQAARLYAHWYDRPVDDLANRFGHLGEGRSAASLQQVLKKYRSSPEGAVAEMERTTVNELAHAVQRHTNGATACAA